MTNTPAGSLQALAQQWRAEEAEQCELTKRYVASPSLYAVHHTRWQMAKEHADDLDACRASLGAALQAVGQYLTHTPECWFAQRQKPECACGMDEAFDKLRTRIGA